MPPHAPTDGAVAHAVLDPKRLFYLSLIGAARIDKGAEWFTAWSEQMRTEYAGLTEAQLKHLWLLAWRVYRMTPEAREQYIRQNTADEEYESWRKYMPKGSPASGAPAEQQNAEVARSSLDSSPPPAPPPAGVTASRSVPLRLGRRLQGWLSGWRTRAALGAALAAAGLALGIRVLQHRVPNPVVPRLGEVVYLMPRSNLYHFAGCRRLSGMVVPARWRGAGEYPCPECAFIHWTSADVAAASMSVLLLMGGIGLAAAGVRRRWCDAELHRGRLDA